MGTTAPNKNSEWRAYPYNQEAKNHLETLAKKYNHTLINKEHYWGTRKMEVFVITKDIVDAIKKSKDADLSKGTSSLANEIDIFFRNKESSPVLWNEGRKTASLGMKTRIGREFRV